MSASNRKMYELTMKLTAALAPDFHSSFKSAMTSANQLQGTLQNLKSRQNDISAYQKTQDAVTAAKNSVKDLGAQYSDLQKRLADTAAKEKELQKALSDSQKVTGKNTDEYKRLKSELDKTKEQKKEFAGKVRETAAEIDKTNDKIGKQEKQLSKLSEELKAAGVNTEQLAKESNKLQAAYDNVRKSQEDLAKVNAKINESKEAISATRAELTKTVAAVTAVGAAFAVPIKGAMEFESAMADVAKVVDWIGSGNNATAEQIRQYNELSDGLYDLTRQIPMTAKELAQITAAAGQANVAMDNAGLLKFAGDAAKMGIAFDISAEQAGQFMSQWRTAFKMTQSEVTDLADVINYLGNTTPATAAQISNVVTRIGPLGEVAGLTSKDLAALGAAIVGVGIDESVAATGIKNLMLDMTKGTAATNKMHAVLESLGTSATELAERMQTDAAGAVMDFMRAVKQLPQAEQAAALTTYFGQESVAAIAPLLSSLDNLEAQFYKVGDASQYAGSMEAEYAARAATSENSLALLKNAVKELSDAFGKIFVPGAESGIQAVTEVIHKAADFVKQNPELIKRITMVGASLAGLKIAGLGAKLGLEQLSLGGQYAEKAFTLLRAKFAENVAEFAMGGGKIIEIGKSITGYFGGVRNSIGGLGKSLDALTGGGASKLSGLFSKAGSGIDSGILKSLGELGNKVTGVLGGIVQKITGGPLGKIGGVFKNIGSAASSVLGGPLKGLGSLFGGLFGKVMPVVMIISALSVLFLKLNGGDISGFIEPLKQAFEQIKPVLSSVAEQFRELGARLMPLLIDTANRLAPLLGELITAVLPVVLYLMESIVPLIIQLAERVLPVVLSVITSIAPLLTEIVTAVLPVLMTLLQKLTPVVQFLADVFGNVLGGAIKSITGVIENVKQVLSGLIEFISGVFTGNWTQAWEGVKSIFGGVFGTIAELAKAPVRAVVEVINGVIGGLNKLKVPDWVPLIGGNGINIPLIPTFAKGTDYTPDTFIAGDINGKGGELITNARGRKVFTAAETTNIFNTINRAREINNALPPAGVSRTNAPEIQPAPLMTGTRGGDTFNIELNPVIHIDGNKPGDLDEKLERFAENLLQRFKEMRRREREDEGRMLYV